jgi:hypothetical protein
LEWIGGNAALILVAIHGVGVILETDPVAVLINDFAGIVDGGVLINDDRSRFEHIDEKHAEEESEEEWQELYVIEKFHNPLLIRGEING